MKTRWKAAAYVALAAADTALAARGGKAKRARLVTKPLLMPALASAYASGTRGDRSTLRTGVLTAQALSGAGDVALLGSGERAFLTGLGSFFAAHVSYVAAFASRGRPLTDREGATGAKAAAGTWLVAAPVMATAAGRKAPELRVPVAAYAGVLSAMVATSTRLRPDLPAGARRTVVAGTALFLLSDGILGAREFLVKDQPAWMDGAVMATYTAGQGLIALGTAQAATATR